MHIDAWKFSWNGVAWRVAQLGICAMLIAICGACMSVTYDMRKLTQPVLMNRNPCVHATDPRVQLAPVDKYEATIFRAMAVTSEQSFDNFMNDAQTKAFEKIGGDNSLIITDVIFDANSFGVNLLLGVANRVEMIGKGAVQKVIPPAPPAKVQP